MLDFHFFLETIFKNCLGSRDTLRDFTVKKIFFQKSQKIINKLKDLKGLSIFQKTVIPESNMFLSYFTLKFLWITFCFFYGIYLYIIFKLFLFSLPFLKKCHEIFNLLIVKLSILINIDNINLFPIYPHFSTLFGICLIQ